MSKNCGLIGEDYKKFASTCEVLVYRELSLCLLILIGKMFLLRLRIRCGQKLRCIIFYFGLYGKKNIFILKSNMVHFDEGKYYTTWEGRVATLNIVDSYHKSKLKENIS